ncbi:MAG: N,N-dimethylformamidase beta subunit family domain-containing protein, partial [Dermatophilaceae bacterium]
MKFRSDVGGYVTGVRFYKGAQNNGTHIGNLWSSSGTLLATATFTGESSSGWQQVSFPPVAVTAGTTYVASYYAPSGYYAADAGAFAAAGVDNAPLHALRDGLDGANGVYAYGATSVFPDQTWQSSNYWVDVVFTTSTGPDTTPPTVSSTSPASGATNVPRSTAVSAVFSEAVDPASVSGSTVSLSGPGGTAVAASVGYDPATRTATLTPTAPLAASTSFTATVKGGTTDPRVKDLAGNALPADVVWSFTTGAAVGACDAPANPTVAENCLAGNPSSEWDVSGAGDLSIQGFATDISVNRGSTVSFKIDTNAAAYRVDIYRLGYYNGMGARKVATIPATSTVATNQPACITDSATGLIDCGNWSTSASWAVPATATSGIYIARPVRSDTGGASHIPFVVRNDASQSDMVMQTSDTTWQAYNTYGGNSLYTGQPAGRAYKVSYNRPFNTRSVDNGQDWLFNAEYPMVRWVERNGYDISYISGVDSDRSGSVLRQHKTFLSVGHDEYWSGTQRANVEAARDAGVNLAFLSGNEVFWKTRWEPSVDVSNTDYRTLVCYKETHANAKIDTNTSVWTGTWRDPRFSPPADGGRPENGLTGT